MFKYHLITTKFFLAASLLFGLPAIAQDVGVKIVGRWYLPVQKQDKGDFTFFSQGVQEYFPNGSMSIQLQSVSRLKEDSSAISCDTVVDYTWSTVGDTLYQKMMGVNTSLGYYVKNGKEVRDSSDLEHAKKICDIELNFRKKYIFKTSSFKIKKIDGAENVYSSINSEGKEVIEKDLRTPYGLEKFYVKKGDFFN